MDLFFLAADWRLIMKRIITALICCAMILPLFAGRAGAIDEEKEKAAITALFVRSFQDGTNEKDLEKILSIYHDMARIRTYAMPQGNKDRLRKLVADELERSVKVSATVEILEISFEGEDAIVHSRTNRIVTDGQGKEQNRASTYYYKLRKVDDAWKVYLQSYRSDFGVTNIEHFGHPATDDLPGGTDPAGE